VRAVAMPFPAMQVSMRCTAEASIPFGEEFQHCTPAFSRAA
jgi:hypothetical protein